jgi:hypothetical protein
MKKLTFTRGEASYTSRGLDTQVEREQVMQEDCIAAIKAFLAGSKVSKMEAEKASKMVLAASAAVHSDLERILRNQGKKKTEEVQ